MYVFSFLSKENNLCHLGDFIRLVFHYFLFPHRNNFLACDSFFYF